MSRRTHIAPRADLSEAAWALVCTSLPVFGYAELCVGLKIHEDVARRIVRVWKGEGRLIEVDPPVTRRLQWRADPTWVPKPAPIARTAEDCMWTAMRQAMSFTPRILAATPAPDGVTITLEGAQAYCRALLASGHLRVARKAVPGKTEPIYRLVRNTGPRPPRERRVRAVVDANTDAVIVIGGLA